MLLFTWHASSKDKNPWNINNSWILLTSKAYVKKKKRLKKKLEKHGGNANPLSKS